MVGNYKPPVATYRILSNISLSISLLLPPPCPSLYLLLSPFLSTGSACGTDKSTSTNTHLYRQVPGTSEGQRLSDRQGHVGSNVSIHTTECQ